MAAAPQVEIDTSKLSEENLKNFKGEPSAKEGKKWVSCEIFHTTPCINPISIS
jgi:hypothetical protein